MEATIVSFAEKRFRSQPVNTEIETDQLISSPGRLYLAPIFVIVFDMSAIGVFKTRITQKVALP